MRVIGAAMIALISMPSVAHDWYPADCCSGGDCAPISDTRIVRTSDGYVIDGQWKFTTAQARRSLSGRYHACFPQVGGAPKCLFVPPDSF